MRGGSVDSEQAGAGRGSLAISVLMCTRNGSRTIEAALRQCIDDLGSANLRSCEVVVVDNGSLDSTLEIVARLSRTAPIPIVVRHAPVAGKLKAFLVGLEAASHEIVTILDDDNLVDPGFFDRVSNLFLRYPQVGVIGSSNRLSSQDAPEWFHAVADMYACGRPRFTGMVSKDADGVEVGDDSMPAGAGMSFRRSAVAEALAGGFAFLNDTERRQRIAGEDTELCMLMRSLGWKFGFDPGMTLRHDIDPSRLSHAVHWDLAFAQGAGGVAVTAFLETRPHDAGGAPLRRRWQWQFIRNVRQLARVMLETSTWPRLGRSEPRETSVVLRLTRRAHALGVLTRLVGLRSRYDDYVRRITQAPWTARRVR